MNEPHIEQREDGLYEKVSGRKKGDLLETYSEDAIYTYLLSDEYVSRRYSEDIADTKELIEITGALDSKDLVEIADYVRSTYNIAVFVRPVRYGDTNFFWALFLFGDVEDSIDKDILNKWPACGEPIRFPNLI